MNPGTVAHARKSAKAPRLSDAARTDRLRGWLRLRYPADRYAVAEEVADGTGFAAGYADALVLCLWPSDGLLLHGYELKVSRADWQRELADPSKHARFARYCDTWSLLTYGTAPARETEIPEGWGWLAVDEEGAFEVLRKPPKRTPEPWPRDFIAALVRRAASAAPCATFAGMVAEAAIEPIRRREAEALGRADRHRKEVDLMRRAVYDMLHPETAGQHVSPYTIGHVVERHLAAKLAPAPGGEGEPPRPTDHGGEG